MERNDIKELYFITPIENIPLIFKHGLLSHNKIKALRISHKSIADDEVQRRRTNKVIPGGKGKLHDYVNLYFNPRNAMMYSRKNLHEELCVLGISADILTHANIIVTDGNASSAYARFFSALDGLKYLKKALVFTEDWRDPNHYAYLRKRSAACAEMLVSDQLSVSFIKKIYASCDKTSRQISFLLAGIKIDIPVIINGKIFFLEV